MSEVAHARVPELTQGWRLKMALGDMPVQEMADVLGVSRSQVSRWMNDRGARPKRAYILQWALMTGVDPVWLESGKAPTQGGDDGGLQPSDNTHSLMGLAA